MDECLGVSAGYVFLPIQSLGFTTALTYLDLKEDSATVGFIRIDGSLAYAFNSLVNIKGGANLSKFTSGGILAEELSPALGLQASLGFQITKISA